MENPHARTVEEVVKYFDTDINYGLSDKQIEENQEKYGPNGEIGFMFSIVYNFIYVMWCDLYVIIFIFILCI